MRLNETNRRFEVKLYKNGQHVDTQIVSARDGWQARSMMLAATKVHFNGDRADYKVRQVQ